MHGGNGENAKGVFNMTDAEFYRREGDKQAREMVHAKGRHEHTSQFVLAESAKAWKEELRVMEERERENGEGR